MEMAYSKRWATSLQMTVLEGYWELGELLTIRYDPNDLSRQLERPNEIFRAFLWACPSFRQKIPWICMCKKKT